MKFYVCIYIQNTFDFSPKIWSLFIYVTSFENTDWKGALEGLRFILKLIKLGPKFFTCVLRSRFVLLNLTFFPSPCDYLFLCVLICLLWFISPRLQIEIWKVELDLRLLFNIFFIRSRRRISIWLVQNYMWILMFGWYGSFYLSSQVSDLNLRS